MKKRISIALLVMALTISLPAGLSAQEQERERTLRLPDKRFGLIVNFAGLGDFALFDEYNDGFQGGLGMKLWLGEKSAVRALLDLYHLNDSVTKSTTFGVGGAFEYHLLQRRVSPYLGALAGIQVETGATNNVGLNFGATMGAEFELVENLNLYGEYALQVSIKDPNFIIDLGLGNAGRLGIIIYLN
jgi:hypothetical protein